jgi:hypothetical protein
MSELEIPFALADQWDQMLKTKGHCATYWEIAQWGADQELEACCEWFQEFYKTESWVKHDLKHFRVARRPRPLSLKEQALEALDEEQAELSIQNYKLIRAVLESLPDHK